MQRNRLIAGIAIGLAVSVAALGEVKSIKQSKLPPAVQRTAEQQSAGAEVTGYSTAKLDGVVTYRMSLMAEGLTRGVVMDKDGNVLSVEQEVAWAELPADIQKTFDGVKAKGELGPVSTVSENGTLVAYVAYLSTKRDRSLVRVKPKAGDQAPPPGASN
jgi:hypothetical protein